MIFNRPFVNVIGCGFAGIECALFLAGHGIKVHLFDSKQDDLYNFNVESDFPERKALNSAILFRELSLLGSPLAKAEENLIISNYQGDRIKKLLDIGKEMVKNNENIDYFEACVHEINPREITVVATGSYTDDGLYKLLFKMFGSLRCFEHKPVYPVVANVDYSKLYEKYLDDKHLYVPLSYEEYLEFVNAIVKALNEEMACGNFKIIPDTIEDYVNKGKDYLKSYVMQPILLENVKVRPYAVIKFRKTENGLRLDNFCTKFSLEHQLEILKKLKGFENAILVKKSDVLDARYLNAKYVVNEFHQASQDENLFFAGSILGINDYKDCIASGLYTAFNVNKYFNEKQMIKMPTTTCIGSLAKKIITKHSSSKPQPFIEDFGHIDEDAEEGQRKIYRYFDLSVEGLAKFKEDYKNGKYV